MSENDFFDLNKVPEHFQTIPGALRMRPTRSRGLLRHLTDSVKISNIISKMMSMISCHFHLKVVHSISRKRWVSSSSETLFFDYHRQHNIRIKVARIFNTYGPKMRLNDGRVLPAFIGQALRGEDLTVFGDGKVPQNSRV